MKYRPDLEVDNLLNEISTEHDEYGHSSKSNYSADAQHERTKELNEHRPWRKGKVTIRQDPLTLYRSSEQTAQNDLLVQEIKRYMHTNLGLRTDGKGGKRVIVFIGFSRSNYHYLRAEEEKNKGYWNDVRFIHGRD